MHKHLFQYGRIAFGVLALVAVVAQGIDIVTRGYSVVNFISFFTIQSNILAAAVLILSAWYVLTRKQSRHFTMLRGAAVVYMVITGVVYWLLLRNVDVQINQEWINIVLHYIMPLVILLDWFIFRAPQRIRYPHALLMWSSFPFIYLMYTLIRGSFAGWYPYPFLDPSIYGYAGITVTSAAILMFTAGLSALLVLETRVNRPELKR